MLMSSEEKTSRDNILKALLDVQSATSLGVTHNKYGDLLATSLSALNFEKTKLSARRHEKFLRCAEKAIHFYAKANDEWSDYFKYDSMRENKEVWLRQYDFDDLSQNGVVIDSSKYARDSDGFFIHVPLDDCLSIYWRATDGYIEKMKNDIQQ